MVLDFGQCNEFLSKINNIKIKVCFIQLIPEKNGIPEMAVLTHLINKFLPFMKKKSFLRPLKIQ
jgi:hypothetical protein